MPKNYQHILALIFAVKEINENPTIIPNVSLGFHICDKNFHPQKTFRGTIGLLSTKHKFIPNYKCDVQNHLIAVIGGLVPKITINMATILNSYKIPQVNSVHKNLDESELELCCSFAIKFIFKKNLDMKLKNVFVILGIMWD